MAAGGYPHAEAARGRIEAPCRRLVPFQLVLKQVGSNKLERHLFDPEPNGASEIWFGVEQIVFRLEPNESTFCPLNGSRPDESIRSALDYGDLSETFACAFGQSSAVPTIWAKCFALTTQKFKKVADRHSLARQVGTALGASRLSRRPSGRHPCFYGCPTFLREGTWVFS